MDFGTETGIFLAYACGLLLICFFGKLLLLPLKLIGKLILNSLIGGAVLMVLNGILGGIGIILPINAITAAVTGLLGIPGIIGIITYFTVFS
ncbi:MAG: pro-sigmaK processing inhibitor BofA family protein [Bacillota bacterium]|nr:pro-sigmaK processing inhibitor BofA family protein [Bacillota bacterium]